MHFIKLKNKFIFDASSLSTGDDTLMLSHGKVDYHNTSIPDDVRDMMYSVIPKEFHKFFNIYFISGNGILSPHVDNPSSCTILFYNRPGNFRTSFYELENENTEVLYSEVSNVSDEQLSQRKYIPNRVYKDEDIKKVGSYVAEPYDAWCLNGKTIHSVEPVDKTTESYRSALILDTVDLTFKQVVALLRQTDSI